MTVPRAALLAVLTAASVSATPAAVPSSDADGPSARALSGETSAAIETPPATASTGTPAPPSPRRDMEAALARPVAGEALRLDLGGGQTMDFVWLASLGLWVGRHEVTNGQYRRFNPKHRSRFRDMFSLDGDDQPAVFVTWDEAHAFGDWVNRSLSDQLPVGYEVRLPSRDLWMSIARNGDTREYPWGNEWPPRYGNFSDETARRTFDPWRGIEDYDDGFPVTCPVAASGTNEAGIAGMAGNVWEWCEDAAGTNETLRACCGGSWDFDTRVDLRVETVAWERRETRVDTVGFRLIVAPARRRP